jgi:hypothetical protein
MKTQHTLTLALAAFAGLSIATAYAAPSYTPDANSPINATPLLDSTSQNLDDFDDFIGVIAAKLPPTESLILPTPVGKTFPKFSSFNTAVQLAVADNATDTQRIVAAATQFQAGNFAGKAKDIVKLIVTNDPTLAEEAVLGAIAGNPAKAADAAAGAILGLVEASSTLNYGDIADEVTTDATRLLIEKVAKAAVASTKKAVNTPTNHTIEVATAIADAVIADSVTLYIDDMARGLVAGAKGITSTSQAAVAAAVLARFNNSPVYETTKFVSEFASGALKAMVIGKPAVPSTDYNNVLNALKTEASVGAGFAADIDAVSAAHIALRNAAGGTEVGAFTAALDATNAAHLEAFMIGAVQNKGSKSGDFVKAAFEDTDVPALTDPVKAAVVGAAVRGKFSSAGKVTNAAIIAATNSMTRAAAVQAAIPNAPAEFAGIITNAAVKTASELSNVATTSDLQADDIASVALSTAVAAGYTSAINDIALQAVKARKKEDHLIVQTLIANPDSAGWREAIVAQATINDKGNATAIKSSAAAGAAAASATDFEKASIGLAADLALESKNNSKEAYNLAVNDYFGAPVDVAGTDHPRTEFSKAILFGRGGVNIKNAGPLMAIAMKYKTGSTTDAELLAISKAIYKKNSTVLDLQYSVVQDILADVGHDQLFDIVDHQTFTHASKLAPEIAAVASAAAPEYAHFVARAGAFRSPTAAGKVGAAAITYGQMKKDRDTSGNPVVDADDTSAVAAISAATILGLLDANLPTDAKKLSAVKNAAGALVKAALLLHDDSSSLIQSDGAPGTSSLQPAKGSAGAVTGLVSQLEGYGGTSVSALHPLAAAAITAAAKAAKKEGLEIAQAAAQAAQFVYQLFPGNSGEIDAAYKTAIVDAITAAGVVAAGPNLLNAVEFGVDEAVLGHLGAGARGINNYTHHSGTGAPVTDISNF